MTTLPLPITRTNTILYCRRWPATVRFYRDLLRLPVAFENAWFVEFRLSADAYLSVADAARTSIPPAAGQGITLAWQVADLDGVQAYLQEQGVETTPIRQRWQARVFYCRDPEGHRLEFWASHSPCTAAI